MKVKELKKILEGASDEMNVLISDVEGSCLQIIGGCASNDHECVYLDTRQEFPDTWFRNGEEIRWINGVGVIPMLSDLSATEEEIILTDESVFFDKNEHSFLLSFYDGFAEGEGLRIEYPKLEDLTDEMIEEIDEYIGGAVCDSGVVNQHDVAVKYGKIVKYEKPVKRLDRDEALICESIQNITLVAWPMIYGKNNPHDLNSAEVLETFRSWGEEFESWWINHPEEWICDHDYVEEVELFAEKKAKEYLSEL